MKPPVKHAVAGSLRVTLFNFLLYARLVGQQSSTDQLLTVQVLEINKITTNNGAVALVIDRSSLQSGMPAQAINETGTLVWVTNGDNKKITVVSSNSSPRFVVKIVALDVSESAGVPAPEAILSDNTTKDLVLGVSKSAGRCKIRFTASGTLSDGVGIETYIITYTITGS